MLNQNFAPSLVRYHEFCGWTNAVLSTSEFSSAQAIKELSVVHGEEIFHSNSAADRQGMMYPARVMKWWFDGDQWDLSGKFMVNHWIIDITCLFYRAMENGTLK